MKKFKFTIKGNEYEVKIKDFEDKIAQIEVNGTEYNVEVHHEVKQVKTPRLVRKPVSSQPGEDKIVKSSGGATIKVEAPLPGNIFKVLVKEGDNIKKGDNLLIMEAMKMENNILAEKDGVVSSIKVKEGDAVLQGDLLIEM
ncbi:MAG: biotin/lipoyl-binding protein [Prolixibacteraceae bacterium]|jgi:biotin carboxyl carrier protein|nr:biotin/lipoyl-binding protein [Prolixibacteraceae bacterium]